MASLTITAPQWGATIISTTAITCTWTTSGNANPSGIKMTIGGAQVYTNSLSSGMTSWYIPNAYVTPGSATITVTWTDFDSTPTTKTTSVNFTVLGGVAPRPPIINSPSYGAQVYESDNISVSWTYQPDTQYNRPQARWFVQLGGYTASGEGSGSSMTIPRNAVPPGSYTLRVDTTNDTGESASSSIQITVLSVTPLAPTITSPQNFATIYPSSELAVTFTYNTPGGQPATGAYFEYRYGTGTWTRISFGSIASGSSITITIPGGRFSIGTLTYRVAVGNAVGGYSPFSAERTLNVVSSAPIMPTLTHPENGSTIYNHQPVEYTWKYNSNVALDQYQFRMQWRLQGDETWATIEQVTANTTWIIDHGKFEGTIEWRVQTANVFGEWSPYSAISAYLYTYPIPIVTPVAPTGGFVDPTIPQTFNWTYASPISLPATAAELAYRLAETEDWTTLSLGPVESALVQYGELPIGDVEWRARMRDSDGQWSKWTDTLLIQTRDIAPEAPTPIEPIGVYLPVNTAIKFGWRHNNAIGTPQGGADIEYSADGGEPMLVHMDGSSQGYTMQPFAIPPGSINWRVRTYNREAVEGPWSILCAFNVTGAAVNPTILSASANGARPAFEWVAAGQVVYQAEMRDAAGNLLHRIEEAALSDKGAYIAPMYMPEGTYTLRVRAKNAYNFWSGWVSATVQVILPARLGPLLAATPDGLAIRLDVDGVDWLEADHVLIYRDGVPILRGQGNQYRDYSASGNVEHIYFARTVYADNTYADGPEARATLALTHSVITPASDATAAWAVRINRDGPPEQSRSGSRQSELIELAGREHPVAEYGEHIRSTRSITLAELGQETAEQLSGAYRLAQPVLLRDVSGGRAWCRISAMNVSSISNRANYMARSVQITLDEVDHNERVEID